MVPKKVSNRKRSVKFADQSRYKQTKTSAQIGNSRSSNLEEEPKAVASSPCKGTTSTKSFDQDIPAYTTRSTTVDVRIATVLTSTFPNLLEAQQTEISLANKHENHVQGDIVCYTTLFP